MAIRIIIFLLVNFSALGLGSFLMGEGPGSDWYQQLALPPWMPPGWVFGFAWTTIMICFSIYMAILWSKTTSKKNTLIVYLVQLILNIAWNPVFFNFNWDFLGLIIISALLLVVGYMLLNYYKIIGLTSLLILPYFIWLMIATSLNAYITLYNS